MYFSNSKRKLTFNRASACLCWGNSQGFVECFFSSQCLTRENICLLVCALKTNKCSKKTESLGMILKAVLMTILSSSLESSHSSLTFVLSLFLFAWCSLLALVFIGVLFPSALSSLASIYVIKFCFTHFPPDFYMTAFGVFFFSSFLLPYEKKIALTYLSLLLSILISN